METVLAGHTIDRIFIDRSPKSPLHQELLTLLQQRQVPYRLVPTAKLNRLTRKNHQGVVAFRSPINFVPLEEVVQASYEQGKAPLILLLDGITDVKNFGAIVRTAACTGVEVVIVPTQGGASLSGDAMKTSAGALAHVPICRVKSLKGAIQYLQASGLSVLACHEKASKVLYQTDLKGPVAIVLGAEDRGISMGNLALADVEAKIPVVGPIASLNVSVAAAVALYEVVRQRQ